MTTSKKDLAQLAREKRNAVTEWKLRVGCKRCGTRQGRLVFHHPDVYSLRVGESYSLPWNRLIDEIAVCEVLCPTCHNRGHYELTNGRKKD